MADPRGHGRAVAVVADRGHARPRHLHDRGVRGGLLVHPSGLRLALPLACTSNGRVTVTAPAIRAGTLARGRVTCQKRQASVQLSLRPADARRLSALKSTIAGVSFGAGAATRFSVVLQSRSSPPP